jgi:hypothetical protein
VDSLNNPAASFTVSKSKGMAVIALNVLTSRRVSLEATAADQGCKMFHGSRTLELRSAGAGIARTSAVTRPRGVSAYRRRA